MPELGHGVFFHHLLQAWDGKGDLNEDGKLSYLELAAYTRRETARYAAVRLQVLQTPQLKADFSGEWILRELANRPVKLPPKEPADKRANVPALFDFAAIARSAEEAKAAQEAWAKHLGIKAVETNSLGIELVLLPPGKFLMGSPASDEDAEDDEKPQVEVMLTQPLYAGKTEVTQEQWTAVMGSTPWTGKQFVEEGANFPASYISHEGATEFCRRLSAKEGVTYRLLTEAEWEYACRAGTTARYHFGDSEEQVSSYAWWGGGYSGAGNAKTEVYPHEVGKKLANPFGMFDMHGNVWEWCQDWYGENLAGGENPTGPESGSKWVRRGGSWGGPAKKCRSGSRSMFSPGLRSSNNGLRVARILSVR